MIDAGQDEDAGRPTIDVSLLIIKQNKLIMLTSLLCLLNTQEMLAFRDLKKNRDPLALKVLYFIYPHDPSLSISLARTSTLPYPRLIFLPSVI